MKRKIIASSVATAVAAIATQAVPAYAADEVQTIVVTAQSRKQSAQDVPIAMQVVTMKEIEALGAADLSEMNGYIPGLSVGEDDKTQSSFGLRGVSSGDFGIGTDAPVGIYVDGVYTGKTGGALMNFNDIQRVEVLKGPQGTLFGRNSAAGAISIVTNEPAPDADAAGSIRYGSDAALHIDAMGNMPLTDSTALRLSFVKESGGSWVENKYNGDDMEDAGSWGTRLAAKWAGTGGAKAVLSWEHEDLDHHARPAFSVIPNAGWTPASYPHTIAAGAAGDRLNRAALAATFIDPRDNDLRNDGISKETRRFDGVSLRIEAPLSGMLFNSTTSWRKFKTYNSGDYDGTANLASHVDTVNEEHNTTWQQEFKLSAKNETFDWVAGLSFFHSRANQTSSVVTNSNTIDSLLQISAGADLATLDGLGANIYGGAGPASGTLWTESVINKVTAKSAALFGDIIWHLTPATNATFGARLTRDFKSMRWQVPAGVSNDPLLASALTGVAGVLAGFGGGYSSLPNLVFNSAATLAATPLSKSKSWSDVSPRLVLDHKLNANTMLFASVSRGYQSGGYNVFAPGGQFDPEKMTNYEAGFKTYLPDYKLSLNASVFAYKFRGLQSIDLVQPSGGGISTYDITVSDQKAHGLDIDGSIKLNKAVRLFAAAEYIDQTYSKYAPDVAGVATDLSGDPVGTPKWTAMAGVNVGWAALNGKADFMLQGTYSGKYRCNAKTREEWNCLRSAAFDTGTSTSRLDMRLGWMTMDGRYGTALIVNNLLDKQYVGAPGGSTTNELGTPYSSITPPRFVGIEFKAAL